MTSDSTDLECRRVQEGTTLVRPEAIHIDVNGSCGVEAALRGHTLCDADKREGFRLENGRAFIGLSVFEYNRFFRDRPIVSIEIVRNEIVSVLDCPRCVFILSREWSSLRATLSETEFLRVMTLNHVRLRSVRFNRKA